MLFNAQIPEVAQRPAAVVSGTENCVGKGEWAIQDSNKNSQHIASNTLIKNTKIERVQNPVHKSEICTDLQKIITVWPGLPEHIKAAIKALVEIHSKNAKQ
jgi:hypothetical protein